MHFCPTLVAAMAKQGIQGALKSGEVLSRVLTLVPWIISYELGKQFCEDFGMNIHCGKLHCRGGEIYIFI
jgi:hypothetical protein